MSASVPGILVSRDGSVRRYIGHSNQNGTLLGWTRRNGRAWEAECAACHSRWNDRYQRDGVYSLKYHWDDADARMAATHVEAV